MALKDKALEIKNNIAQKVNDISNKVALPTEARDLSGAEIKKGKLDNQVIFFIFLLIGILVLGGIILVSRVFRVYMTVTKMGVYRTNQIKQKSLNDIYSEDDLADKKLRDFYVASAYRPYVCGLHKYDYVSVEVFTEVLKCGARMVELEIFNSGYGVNVEPVVSCGEEEGEWKYTLNTMNVKAFLKEIKKVCFNLKDVTNYNDPFIIYLNLKTNKMLGV